MGKTAQVVEGNDASTIQYAYDAMGNVRSTNTNGQVISMSYDAFSRKVSMTDPTMGVWSYRYNPYGELIWQRDAKGQVTSQTYDDLGRMISRSTSDDNATWVYDTAQYGIGKLAVERNKSTETTYVYDKLGRPTQTTRTIAGQSYVSKVGYDAYSHPALELYPDGVKLNRAYTDTGYLQRITTPKNNVWDYDYLKLEESLKQLEKALVELHTQAYEHEEKYIALIKKAQEYQLIAQQWEHKAQQELQEVNQIKAIANQLQAQADAHRAQAQQYRALAQHYWAVYGDMYFDYAYSANGYGYYEKEVCTGTNWKGNCDGHYTYRVQIAQSLLPTVCHYDAKWGWCEWGPPRSLNLTTFYNEQAQLMDNVVASDNQALAAQQAQVRTAEQELAYARQQADYYKRLAQQQYDAARAETELLKKLTNKIEDYEQASYEIEKALSAHTNNQNEILLWAATSHDAAGRLQGEIIGNGLLTRREYDPYSGRLERISTGIEEGGKPLVRDLRYTYDGVDNVATRQDIVAGTKDTYQYDAYDRLISAVRTASTPAARFNLAYQYDIFGNLLNKSGAGSMSYDNANNRLQTLTKTDGTTKSYTYDANGNMLQAGDNVVKWTSFNQPLEVKNSKTNTTATFMYDANQQRVQQMTGVTGKSETTVYVSKAYEVTHLDNGVNDRLTQQKHYIYAGGEVIAIQIRTLKNGAKTPDETRYLHKDNLGNIDTITDSKGVVIQRLSYDPFGKRTVTAGIDPDKKAWTARGFTGHEHLEGLGLIHMNARLYDPEIGRFISPDTYIQAPNQSQNYNRYVCVMNNPLKYTDPSGHFFNFIIGAIIAIVASQSDNKYIQALGMAAGMALMGGAFGGSLFSHAIGNAAAAGFVQGYATTGSFKGAMQGAFYGGLSAGIAGFIGHSGVFKTIYSQGLAHGVAQGVISNLRGGSFKSGFVGGIIGKASGVATSGMGGTSGMAITLRTVTAAVFGGLASEATGGSFADGALSAALTHLFNEEGAQWWEDNYSLSQFGLHNGTAPFTETDAVFWEVMGASIPVGGAGAWLVGRLSGRMLEIAPGKFNYLFGRVSSNAHNADRSNQLALEMKRLGVPDTQAGYKILTEHLTVSVKTNGNVSRTFSNQYGKFEVRESFFIGPSGKAAKFESTFQILNNGNRRLSTIIPKGG
ncbi:MAG: RHS repeat-associated core domain-containing protein [Thiofilum sp.]|uniref:RHS repeat-associated core domain-containing protein n=1 Tax=Thiofilum sp. TaxID=2212733 RepID=UPI0025EF0407|nr:RHS repeat-associated core domain-containing protein [Thiofilum sp.]MBK8455198.1 hypothetical protein [Thiofilum sp.]